MRIGITSEDWKMHVKSQWLECKKCKYFTKTKPRTKFANDNMFNSCYKNDDIIENIGDGRV